jgi:pimeloyl-ACP methyl ester carboxylesterase
MKQATVRSFDGSILRYETSLGNSQTTLVFIHGWSCSKEFWKLQKERLSERFDIVFLDLAGHGESEYAQRQGSMENFAQDVVAVLDHAGIKEWIAVGHSMGGAVALELAKIEAERTSAVIGVDCFTYDGFYQRMSEADIEDTIEPFRRNFSTAMRETVETFFLPETSQELKAWVGVEMERSPEKPALASLAALLRWDVDEALAACSVPVKCISAAAFLDPQSEERLSRKIEIMQMERVGHFLMLEEPEVFNDLLITLSTPFLSD